MYKLEFTLKQHTPIIHFQHDQEGATLRASEVKPKLDRFLMEKMKAYDKSIPRRWFIRDHEALNYKLRIDIIKLKNKDTINQIELIERPKLDKNGNVVRKKNNEIDYFQYPTFFGNMGDADDENKKFSIADEVKVTIISSIIKLDEVITESIFEEFLSKTNFGMRQSKGFGSYYLIGKRPNLKYHFSVDCSNPEFDSIIDKIEKLKYQSYKDIEYYKIKKLFSVISLFYSTLRSGINTSNFGGIYFKSLMFMYAKHLSPPQQWDKRTLREEFYSDHPTYQKVKEQRSGSNGTVHYNQGKKSKLLFRDLLGLSTEQDWLNYGVEKTNKNVNYLNDKSTIYGSDTLTKKNDQINRFKSPITFKPIRRKDNDIFDVFISTEEIPKEYYDQLFSITSKRWSEKMISMKIPSPEIFTIENYLEFCFKEIFPNDDSIIKHIGNKDKKESKLLIKIYSELRECK